MTGIYALCNVGTRSKKAKHKELLSPVTSSTECVFIKQSEKVNAQLEEPMLMYFQCHGAGIALSADMIE